MSSFMISPEIPTETGTTAPTPLPLPRRDQAALQSFEGVPVLDQHQQLAVYLGAIAGCAGLLGRARRGHVHNGVTMLVLTRPRAEFSDLDPLPDDTESGAGLRRRQRPWRPHAILDSIADLPAWVYQS